MTKFRAKIRNFFFPPRNSPRWMLILPYTILGVVTLLLLVGGAYGWEYTNSPAFCGTTCHTMPPEYAAYEVSPHARIACVECHIGREFIGNQIFRKAGDLRHVFATAFRTYEYPIQVKNMRPAPETCEKCHTPEKFSDDSLRIKTHFSPDENNTPYSIYLILKTGGGSKRIGLGRGIHWHIENQVQFLSTDELDQEIPYIRVTNDDGSVDEYVDIEADFDPSSVNTENLKTMDCITCHNRITHTIPFPEQSIDTAMARGLISPAIPEIRRRAVDTLSIPYVTREIAMEAFDALEAYYTGTDYYAGHSEQIHQAIQAIKDIYDQTVFIDQKVDWNAHPNNIGHILNPGCFRCHDGKHLDANQQAIRLECNLCHSIPVVAGAQDFVTDIEISRGPEPETHLNANWISMHNQAIDASCSNCHTTDDPGGTSNTSFCSNSACHGNVFTYAGFDAPALREIIKDQLPPPVHAPELPVSTGHPTYATYAGPLFAAKCTVCHGGSAPQKGLDLSTYADAMRGGNDGVVIAPGDSANSKLVQVQSSQHFANLSTDELAIIMEWIDAGAPEK